MGLKKFSFTKLLHLSKHLTKVLSILKRGSLCKPRLEEAAEDPCEVVVGEINKHKYE